jgi:hypothetical protein
MFFKLTSYKVEPWHGKCSSPLALLAKGYGLGRFHVAADRLWGYRHWF